MENSNATQIFESLASATRLDIYRLLVKAGPDGMVAGQIGATLAQPSNKLSFHLKEMTHAGLLTATQEGRFNRYRANYPLIQELIAFLTEECCTGVPEACGESSGESCCAESEA